MALNRASSASPSVSAHASAGDSKAERSACRSGQGEPSGVGEASSPMVGRLPIRTTTPWRVASGSLVASASRRVNSRSGVSRYKLVSSAGAGCSQSKNNAT